MGSLRPSAPHPATRRFPTSSPTPKPLATAAEFRASESPYLTRATNAEFRASETTTRTKGSRNRRAGSKNLEPDPRDERTEFRAAKLQREPKVRAGAHAVSAHSSHYCATPAIWRLLLAAHPQLHTQQPPPLPYQLDVSSNGHAHFHEIRLFDRSAAADFGPAGCAKSLTSAAAGLRC